MAISITPINISTDTFEDQVSVINNVINAIATEVVTVNSHALGGSTTGNGYVVGIFGASTLAGNNLRGGTVNATANLNIISNTVINTSFSVISGNTLVNSTSVVADNIIANSKLTLTTGSIVPFTWTTTGTSQQNVDSFLINTYRSAEYSVSIKDNVANGYQFTKVLVIHDGTNAYLTEYGTVYSNASLGTFTTLQNTTAVCLAFTPTSANSTINGTRISLNV